MRAVLVVKNYIEKNLCNELNLQNAYRSGRTEIPGSRSAPQNKVTSAYQMAGARLLSAFVYAAGCRTHVRNCATYYSHQGRMYDHHL